MRVYENGKYRDMTPEEVAEHNKLAAKYAEQEVEATKQELNESDYKIIKCMEYYLVGKELPYDINALHEERQGKRDKINGKKPK